MQSESRKPKTGWAIALAGTILVCYLLYFYVKYTLGYGHTPITISRMLWGLWNDYGDWQHGMLVPVIVGWLVYRDRRKLSQLPVKGENYALAAILFSLAFYWVGFKADIQYIGFVSAQMLIASLVLWFLGYRFFKFLLFPLGFIIFMWPFLFLDNLIAFPLRLVMSEISYRFLDLIGLDVIKQGSAVVSAPNFAEGIEQGERFAVDIADPCSGIRSLFALAMITAVYAHITLKSAWRKWVLFLMAVPLAIFGNFVRILMLTFGTLAFGSTFAIGEIDHPSTYHLAAGFVVFGVALAGMLGIALILRRIGRKPEPAEQSVKEDDNTPRPLLSGPIPVWRTVVVVIAGVITVAFCQLGNNDSSRTTEAGVNMDLPIVVGGYYGTESEVSKSEKTILPLDTEFAKKFYRSVDGKTSVNFQVVLSGGERRSLHRPEICLPGQGWTVKSANTTPIELESGQILQAMQLDLSRPRQISDDKTIDERAVFLYWFIGSDTTTPYHWQRIVYTSWDRVFRNTNHRWAYVVLQSPVMRSYSPRGADSEETLASLKDFAREIIPYFMRPEVKIGE